VCCLKEGGCCFQPLKSQWSFKRGKNNGEEYQISLAAAAASFRKIKSDYVGYSISSSFAHSHVQIHSIDASA
jgi:hypothetical protein